MSTERRKPYPFDQLEPKWQAHWETARTFHAPNPGDPGFDPARPKYYVLDMFPYPSGAGLHVGHPEGYTATDILGRYKMMRGFNVLHPMGWDAFGLPAEQYAIKTGQHPAVTTAQNVAHFKGQLQRIGFGYDWQREVNTTDPGYFRWTQWIFLQIYNSYFDPDLRKAMPIAHLEDALSENPERKKEWPEKGWLWACHKVMAQRGWGALSAEENRKEVARMIETNRLAYVAEAAVNWCPELGTVLANEEVVDGKSEVGGFPVVRKPMRQWMLRITAYAQRLIDELEGLDWPHGIKLLQKNWIGRSEGAEVWFQVAGGGNSGKGTEPSGAEASLAGRVGVPPAGEGILPARSSQTTTYPDAIGDATAAGSASGDSLEDRSGGTPQPAGGTPTQPAPPPRALSIAVFTTRPDTLYGATYLVVAPEHALVDALTAAEQRAAVAEYREKTARKSDLERTELAKEKSGVWTGAFALNPVNGERLPIWIADYVLLGYGTGAIMAVPAHDERDWEFARQYALPIRAVVSATPTLGLGGGESPCSAEPLECFPGEGFAIHSGPLDGLPTPDAKAEITRLLAAQGLGKKTINYKLRDWLFSRQRYWGEPFPIVWEAGRHRALDPSELPLTPPELADFKPTGTGEPPLAKAKDWLQYRPVHHEPGETTAAGFPLPSLGLIEGATPPAPGATRETNTMPQWAGSCWYYLRYCDPGNADAFVGKEAERYWMTGQIGAPPVDTDKFAHGTLASDLVAPSAGLPAGKSGTFEGQERTSEHPDTPLSSSVPAGPAPNRGGVDLYVGGTEHAVLHLLYARFWHKVLFDLGHVSTPEPFQRLVNQGLILGEDGQKMSKSRGNVVNPDTVIAEYGADALRCYLMFMGPLEASKPWSMNGVEGVSRFLARVWRLVMEENQAGEWVRSAALQDVLPDKAQLKILHATIKKVGEDIEALSFNTAISQMMIFVNAFIPANPRPLGAMRTLVQLLNPFAPHLTEELWEQLGGGSGGPLEGPNGGPRSLATEPWPAYDPALLIEDEIEMPIQVNGKVRDKIVVPRDATKEAVEAAARGSAKVAEWTAGKEIRKVVVVPGKLVNIVV